MIPINIEVKESAYDKVIYLLNHLKDDVSFKLEHHPDRAVPNEEKVQQIKTLKRLARLDQLVAQSNNSVQVTREIATDTDGKGFKKLQKYTNLNIEVL